MRAGEYVALSGPRQSGKTSVLRALVDDLNTDGWGRAVLLSCEVADQRFGVTAVDDAERLLVKVHRDHDGDPVQQGLEQLDRYCAGLRVDTGWLVVFDQRKTATGTRLEPEEVVTPGGRKVLVVRA